MVSGELKRKDNTYYPTLGRAKFGKYVGSAPQARPHCFPLLELAAEVETGGAEDVGVVDVGAGVEVGGREEDGLGLQALAEEESPRLRLATASWPWT